MMDFSEAKACLEEYRDDILETCQTLATFVATGDRQDINLKTHAFLISRLRELSFEARILATRIVKEISELVQASSDFWNEFGSLQVALTELFDAIDEASKTDADYLQGNEAGKGNIPGAAAL